MDDVTYWKERCAAAEDALRRARSRLWISPARRRYLSVLADLKTGQVATTENIARMVGRSSEAARAALQKLYEAGLVERTAKHGCHHAPVQWKLGHLVTVEDVEASCSP